MDAILLCMKKRGIRFFSKIEFPNTEVYRYYQKGPFLRMLHSRFKEFDNVLIMAHGSSNGIIMPTRDLNHEYITYISLDEANAFKNDFVCAISCDTANEFGRRCVEEGAVAYLGYEVEIGQLFSTANPNIIPNRISKLFDMIIKHIFIKELSQSYEKFLQEPISVQVLKEYFSYSVERRLSNLLEMSTEQVFEEYQIKIRPVDFRKYGAAIIVDTLSLLNEISRHLICIGDKNYIAAGFIKKRKTMGMENDAILAELKSNRFYIALEHEAYKQHLISTIKAS
jgi:hypothetical protein